jgi:hypothetical protein
MMDGTAMADTELQRSLAAEREAKRIADEESCRRERERLTALIMTPTPRFQRFAITGSQRNRSRQP